MVLDDVYNRLISDSVAGGSTGWECYVGTMQDSPDKQIAIVETGGGDPVNTMGGLSAGRPSIMVMVRGEQQDYETVRSKINEVAESLHFYTVNDRFFKIAGSFVPTGEDGNGRHVITLNFDIISIGNF